MNIFREIQQIQYSNIIFREIQQIQYSNTKSYQSPPLLLSLSSFFISFCFPLFNFDFICFSLLTIASKSRLTDFLTSDKIVSSLSILRFLIPSPVSPSHLTQDVPELGSTSILHRQHHVTSPCLPHFIVPC